MPLLEDLNASVRGLRPCPLGFSQITLYLNAETMKPLLACLFVLP